jgi:hypothetical protein
MGIEEVWSDTDGVLLELGWARTRKNYIRAMWDQPPEGWDADCEEQLPPDLRLEIAPSSPFNDPEA